MTARPGADPMDPAPMPGFPRVGFLAAFAAGRPNVEIGRYSYYDDPAGGWEEGFDPATWAAENRGDTVVGPDVWIGHEALLLPGARIGAGAVIGARAVVSGEVRPYALVAGNPAREVRRRFDSATVERLLALAWWDWPVEKTTRNLDAIHGQDIARLEGAR